MKFGQKVRRAAQVVTSACVAGACLAGASSSALARSAALPGITVGLPTGWQVPEGIQMALTTSFAERSTQPRDNQGNNNLVVFLWATPWKVLGGQLRFLQSFPFNAASPQGGLYQPLTTAQIAWKINDNLGVSYFLGGFWPSDTLLALRSASIAQRFAISYVGDGWNVTANLHYGTMLAENSPTNVHYSDYLNLDLTATKRFGKWSFGAVAFGSTDLPTNRRGYRPGGQFAMGPLVAYAFDKFTVQSFVTRDIAQRNLGGEETRAWLRFLVPLWRPEKGEQVPNRVTVRRNSAAGPAIAGQ